METTVKPMTIKEILIEIRDLLGGVEVPAAKIEQIGIPVARSINGIQVCINAIEKEEAMKSEPEISLECVENDPKKAEEDNA